MDFERNHSLTSSTLPSESLTSSPGCFSSIVRIILGINLLHAVGKAPI